MKTWLIPFKKLNYSKVNQRSVLSSTKVIFLVLVAESSKISDNMSEEYKALLETMRHNYELWQQFSNETWAKYAEVWQKAIGSSPELQKRIAETWQKAPYEAGMEQMKKFSEMWENALKVSSSESIKTFGKYWQNFWSTTTDEQFKAYRDTLQKFTEQQQKIGINKQSD